MIRAYPKIFTIGTDYINDLFKEEVEKLGYKTINWNYDVGDWYVNNKTKENLFNRLNYIKDNDIVLMHDSSKTAKLFKEVINKLEVNWGIIKEDK